MNNIILRQLFRLFSAVGGFFFAISVIGVIPSPYVFAQDTDFSQYEVIEDRNIFRPLSDPAAKDKANPAASSTTTSTTASAAEFVLTGIIKIKGQYLAILEKKSGEKGFTVRVNDKIEDYTVKDIQKDSVTLEKDGRLTIIALNISSKDKSVAERKTATPSEGLATDEEANDKEIIDTNIMRKLRMGGIP
jgi:type II secretory pathway component PulC